MGKRFLISALMTLLVIVLVTAGAAYIFHSNYTTIAALEAQSPSEPAPSKLPTLTARESPAQATAAQPQTTSRPVTVGAAGNSRAKSIVSEMTLQEKICQMLFVSPEALTGYSRVTQSGDATREAISTYPVGGIIYFSSNLVTQDQTREMITNVQNYARERTGFDLLVGVEEEGGSVARLAGTLGTVDFESMAYYGQEGDSQAGYDIARAISADMKSLGFNLDFAPVADVLTNPDNTSIGDRSFGSDPQLVADFVSREVQGFADNGVLSVPGHFPGQGSASGDAYSETSDRTAEELRASELVPFRAAIQAGAPMIMMGGMTMTSIDPELPASLSPAVVGMLRQEYDGVIISGMLNDGPIGSRYSIGDSAILAIQAGCDMLLCVDDVATAVEAITAAVENGTISRERIDESAVRIITAKLSYGLAA